RYLGLSPECKRPGCSNPVPRDTNGEWFKCCSPYCALEMGEDIPLLAGYQAGGAKGGPPTPSRVQQTQEEYEREQAIMSARVCGSLFLLWLAYRLVWGAGIDLDLWGEVLIILAGLTMVVWGYSAKLPKG
ncbi:MAG TPA: hypothetical protein VFR37_13655, partial [Longimicrobium sp.]|nr:hypothetical protein [Longimicrobium sp.]